MAKPFLIFLHLVSLLIFGKQVDLPSNFRCDLRQLKNFTQSGGSIAVMNSSAREEGGAMGFGVWLIVA